MANNGYKDLILMINDWLSEFDATLSHYLSTQYNFDIIAYKKNEA